jgi:hypothetical protein
MNRVFRLSPAVRVPDGTHVRTGLAHPAVDLSIAGGEIEPHTASKIHLHPLVTQVTWVRSGTLTVRMKNAAAPAPYTLTLGPDESVVTRPGTFFQLVNDTGAPCHVLYIVQPAFLFVADPAGRVIYNDAVVFDADWAELAAAGWPQPDPDVLRAEREKFRLPTQPSGLCWEF